MDMRKLTATPPNPTPTPTPHSRLRFQVQNLAVNLQARRVRPLDKFAFAFCNEHGVFLHESDCAVQVDTDIDVDILLRVGLCESV